MVQTAQDNVTLSGLARQLGLAKSTVSRALNGYPDIAAGTQARVLAAAAESGYRASSTARNLKRGRVDTIGIVLSQDGPDLSNPFLAQFLRGVTSTLETFGLDLLVTASDDWSETYARLIASRKVDGFILTRTSARDARVDYLRSRGVPFVTHGRTASSAPFAWIDMDNRAAFKMATERLASFGHRRIGFIGTTTRLNFSADRYAGYRDACQALELEQDASLVKIGGMDADDGWRAAHALLAQTRPPTALLCIRDEVAIGAIRACRSLGLTVGQDVSVIGYDDVPLGQYLDPPLTTFGQDSAAIGRRVAEMMAAHISGKGAKTLQEIRSPKLVARASDGPARRTSQELKAMLNACLSLDDKKRANTTIKGD